MSLDNVLEILRERGLTLRVQIDGKVVLKGKTSEITDAVRQTVTAYKSEIVERFRPRLPRRIVLLCDDGSEEIEKILEECERDWHHERIGYYADQHPERTVAGEWHRQQNGRDEWVRFLTVNRSHKQTGDPQP